VKKARTQLKQKQSAADRLRSKQERLHAEIKQCMEVGATGARRCCSTTACQHTLAWG
jgi:hypothetical protein